MRSSITQTQTRSTPASPEQSQAQTAARSLEICSSIRKWAHSAAALPQSNAVRDHNWRPPSALAHSRPRAAAPVRAMLAVVRARIPFASLVRGDRLLLLHRRESFTAALPSPPNPRGPSLGIQPAVRNSVRAPPLQLSSSRSPHLMSPRDDCVTPAVVVEPIAPCRPESYWQSAPAHAHAQAHPPRPRLRPRPSARDV